MSDLTQLYETRLPSYLMRKELFNQISLLNNQILNLFSAPVIMIPAVPNQVIIPLRMIFDFDTSNGALNQSMNLRLRWLNNPQNLITQLSPSPLLANAVKGMGYSSTGAQYLGSVYTDMVNQPLILTADFDRTGGHINNKYILSINYFLWTPLAN